MKYYKKLKTNEVYGLTETQQPSELFDFEYVQITEEEVDELTKPTTEELAAEARSDRDWRLTEIDVIVSNPFRYAELSEGDKEALKVYRQQLLDIPQQKGFPHNIIEPTPPKCFF